MHQRSGEILIWPKQPTIQCDPKDRFRNVIPVARAARSTQAGVNESAAFQVQPSGSI